MIRAFAATALAVALLPGLPGQARAQAAFDGAWSVLIITDKGTCDKAYRYPLSIRNGIIANGGTSSFDIAGRVGPGGTVQVRISAGGQRADGTGRLASKTGSGSWSAGGQCSGRWRAERRKA